MKPPASRAAIDSSADVAEVIRAFSLPLLIVDDPHVCYRGPRQTALGQLTQLSNNLSQRQIRSTVLYPQTLEALHALIST